MTETTPSLHLEFSASRRQLLRASALSVGSRLNQERPQVTGRNPQMPRGGSPPLCAFADRLRGNNPQLEGGETAAPSLDQADPLPEVAQRSSSLPSNEPSSREGVGSSRLRVVDATASARVGLVILRSDGTLFVRRHGGSWHMMTAPPVPRGMALVKLTASNTWGLVVQRSDGALFCRRESVWTQVEPPPGCCWGSES
jgi:hypothetical protein